MERGDTSPSACNDARGLRIGYRVAVRLERWVGAAASIGSLLASSASTADVAKDVCIDANAKAQDLRRDHKLAAARAQLATCSDASCPSLVRNDCAQRLHELDRAQPTVVFDVGNAAGGTISGVKVTVDGVPIGEVKEGTALPLDPGSHDVTFEAPGMIPLTRTALMIEGDKAHHERVLLTAVATPTHAAVEPVSSGGLLAGTPRWISIALVSSGASGIALGGIFGALTLSEKGAQRSACPTPCSASAHAQADSDHATGITDSTVSTVSFVAGGLLLAAGAFVFFTSSPARTEPASPQVSIVPSIGPGANGLAITGFF
jgi:hypothetical protein